MKTRMDKQLIHLIMRELAGDHDALEHFSKFDDDIIEYHKYLVYEQGYAEGQVYTKSDGTIAHVDLYFLTYHGQVALINKEKFEFVYE